MDWEKNEDEFQKGVGLVCPLQSTTGKKPHTSWKTSNFAWQNLPEKLLEQSKIIFRALLRPWALDYFWDQEDKCIIMT